MAPSYAVPGVYYEPRPRVEPRPLARTDVTGFIGFEPRVRDGTTPTQLTGDPPAGHAFRVDVIRFMLPRTAFDGARLYVPAVRDLVLSESATSIPIEPRGSIRYALAAAADGETVQLMVAAGPASATADAATPTDEDLAVLAAGRRWIRIGDVHVRRSAAGTQVFPTVIPALLPTRCDDWADFELALGGLPPVDDGTLLA